ncbi:hypothetical protein RRG08_013670 [Elysia crispata]|uniref:Uncharacterized protein n=1 Tax=Elysia crispata TaxID=231223 RepID=A0AAE1DRK9_9GAST|nr:hypothetical protein RRG08_013670 [Elysia crispata]
MACKPESTGVETIVQRNQRKTTKRTNHRETARIHSIKKSHVMTNVLSHPLISMARKLRRKGEKDLTGYCYLIGRCGASDIASCMMKYLEDLNRSGSIKKVKLLSDSAGGQNRNWPFMAMLWWAAQHFDFKEINHVFFVRGHSENERDSTHARTEASSKHVNVYTTSQWATVIQGAKRNACGVSLQTLSQPH